MMIPLLFKLDDKTVLVIGGGQVAARRIRTLLENKAAVVCVSPEFSERILQLQDSRLTLMQGRYQKEQLSDGDLVVAATDSRELNRQIKADCEAAKIWCNRVDDPDDSDFIFPSVIRRGDLTVSVCTEGASPFLTKSIVADLSKQYDESYVERTKLLGELRQRLLAGEATGTEKREQLAAFAHYSVARLREKLNEVGDPLTEAKKTPEELEKNR